MRGAGLGLAAGASGVLPWRPIGPAVAAAPIKGTAPLMPASAAGAASGARAAGARSASVAASAPAATRPAPPSAISAVLRGKVEVVGVRVVVIVSVIVSIGFEPIAGGRSF